MTTIVDRFSEMYISLVQSVEQSNLTKAFGDSVCVLMCERRFQFKFNLNLMLENFSAFSTHFI